MLRRLERIKYNISFKCNTLLNNDLSQSGLVEKAERSYLISNTIDVQCDSVLFNTQNLSSRLTKFYPNQVNQNNVVLHFNMNDNGELKTILIESNRSSIINS